MLDKIDAERLYFTVDRRIVSERLIRSQSGQSPRQRQTHRKVGAPSLGYGLGL